MRKKLLSILLTLALLLSLLPAGYAADIEIVDEPAGADAPGGPLDEIVIDDTAEVDVPLEPTSDSGTLDNGITWSRDNAGNLTISGNGPIPDYSGTTGGTAPWFSHWESVTSLTIGYGITRIGNYAFYGLDISTVTIPSSVTSIGDHAFRACEKLTSVSIPNSVTSIEASAFSDTRLVSVSIPSSVTSLSDSVFHSCYSLKSVSLPSTLKTIGNNAFSHCWSLTDISIPGSVTSIGGDAFSECKNLKTISIPDSVTSLGYAIFESCESLENVTLGKGVTEIPYHMFCKCSMLSKINIPNNIVSIGVCAFAASGLQSVSIPSSVHTIAEGAFSECPFESIYFPDSVKSLSGCLKGCSNLKNVRLPSGLSTIPSSMFSMCSSLPGVTIPNSVTEIEAMAFYYCVGLTDITIPDGVQYIKAYAFNNCDSLTSVVIPESVTFIDSVAFAECDKLSTIRFEGAAPEMLNGCFGEVTATAYYPAFDPSWTDEVRQDYGGHITWVADTSKPVSGQCGDKLIWTMKGNTLTISGTGAMWAFGYNSTPWYEFRSSIVTVDIQDGATSIGRHAFYDCTKLTSVTIPEGVTSIGKLAFGRCWSLQSLTIPESVKSIQDQAFFYCTGLTSIMIPAGVTSIAGNAFELCSALEAIIVAGGNQNYQSLDGVLLTKDGTMLICCPAGKAGNYAVPAGVKTIREKAFDHCSGLTGIYFEGPAPAFGASCFSGVTATAYYPGNDPSWTESVMKDYGGHITWAPYGETADEYTITLTDKTKGAAQTSLDLNAKYSGEVSFTVSASQAVLVAVKNGDAYTVLPCTTVGGEHSFTLNVTGDTEIALAFKGDVNLDGSLDLKDSLWVKKYVAGDAGQIGDQIQLLAGDVNADGSVNLKDLLAIKKAIAGSPFAW